MTRHSLLPLDLGMLLAVSFFHTPSGTRIVLGPEIGRGGEGTVYEVVGAPDLVAKVYTDGRADDRREKIEAMVSAGLHRQASHISIPIDVLLGDKGTFVGFTMRRIKGALPIHQLWGSRDRQDKFPDATVAFMVRVAGNAARAVGELHQAGCVIGDINESGFLVTDQATVVLIDSDSIQVTVGNRVFPCVVGTPQYLPPEHQSVNQRQLGARAANHDNFGLAVMIFRLLMAGTHPFMGRWNGPGDPPALPKWIEEFRYAYGTDAARMKVGPQPAAPPIDWLSDEIRAAFNQAFGKSGVQTRPTAADWIGVLDQFEKSLMACGRSRYHHHRPGVRSCPWCETEKTRGKALFGPPTPPPPPHFQQTPFTTPPPGQTPSAPRITPQPTPINALRNTALAIVGVTIAAIWMFGGGKEQAPRLAVQPTLQAIVTPQQSPTETQINTERLRREQERLAALQQWDFQSWSIGHSISLHAGQPLHVNTRLCCNETGGLVVKLVSVERDTQQTLTLNFEAYAPPQDLAASRFVNRKPPDREFLLFVYRDAPHPAGGFYARALHLLDDAGQRYEALDGLEGQPVEQWNSSAYSAFFPFEATSSFHVRFPIPQRPLTSLKFVSPSLSGHQVEWSWTVFDVQ